MDKTRILQQGEEAKFQIEIKDFDMEENDFRVQLVWGYRRHAMTIEKNQMVHGADGKYYITFDTSQMSNRVTAICTWNVPDTDYADGYRQETNEQYLCFVAVVPCPRLSCPTCAFTQSQPVVYTRTETSSIADEYTYLSCSDYDLLLTCDDEILLVLKEIAEQNQNNE